MKSLQLFLIFLGSLVVLGLLLPEKNIRLFRSVRFNVWLFLVIAVASCIGTLIPQNKPPEEALAKFGPFWTDVFKNLGFFDVYHAWWFSGLLALMAFDVVACKLRRWPLLVHGPLQQKEMDRQKMVEGLLSQSKQKDHFLCERSLDEASHGVRRWLVEKKLSFIEVPIPLHHGEGKHGLAFFTGRHRLQRWGDFILHVSLVVILAGGLIGALFGFEEMLPIIEGQTASMKNRPFDVTLVDFDIEYYKATGAPSLYASQLVVKDGPSVLAEKRIVVNDPLDINRTRFYQASWGMTDRFRSAMLFMAGSVIELKPDEIKPIPGTPFSVRAGLFYPSFDVDSHGHAMTLDYEGRNPALLIEFLGKRNEPQVSVWLLKNHPDRAFRVDGDRVFPTAPPPFHVMDVDPILFSGVQVAYDPGAPVFWIGAIFLLTGLCLHFYMHQRRLRILVVPRAEKVGVFIGGWNSRAAQEFDTEFKTWAGEIRKKLDIRE